jgi:hypothetical protein
MTHAHQAFQIRTLTHRGHLLAPYPPVDDRSLTVVVSRALTSPLLTLFLSNKLGLNPQDVGLLLGIAVFSATLLVAVRRLHHRPVGKASVADPDHALQRHRLDPADLRRRTSI